MPVTLRQPLTLAECQLVREWRNDPAVLPMLRTGYKTEEEQAQFYRSVICNPEADHWYYAVEAGGVFVGMGGLTYVSRTPGEAEISLLLGRSFRGKRVGDYAVDALLEEASERGLTSVVGECYVSGHLTFWARQMARSDYPSQRWIDGDSLKWRWTL